MTTQHPPRRAGKGSAAPPGAGRRWARCALRNCHINTNEGGNHDCEMDER
jgi:hypothetical protein